MKSSKNRILALWLGFGVLLGACLLPLRAFADDDPAPDGTLTFTFRIADGDTSRLALAARNAQNEILPPGSAEAGVDLLLTVDNDSEHPSFISPIRSSNNEGYPREDISVSCASASSCTLTLTLSGVIDDGVKFYTPGDVPYSLHYADGSAYNATATNLTHDANFEYYISEEIHDEYSGRAWVAWQCAEAAGVCLDLLTIPASTDNVDASTRIFTYFRNTEVVDDRTGETFSNFSDENTRGFIFESALDRWIEAYKEREHVSAIDWATVNINDLLTGTQMWQIEEELIERGLCDGTLAREQIERCVDDYVANHPDEYQVIEGVKRGYMGEPIGASSYVSYGEHAFNAIIYRAEDYAAVTAVNVDGLPYVPYTFGVDPVDLVGTSPESPAMLNMPLLDTQIYLASTAVNGFEISSITVADESIPAAAVSVAPDAGSSAYVVNFGSNFYDSVVLKITGTNNEVYYLEIHRITFSQMQFEHANPFNNNFSGIRVEMIFDEETSYADYELTAQIVYLDGSVESVSLENLGWVDENYGGNLVFAPEYSGSMSGKGLKRANYGYTIDDNRFEEDIATVYFNIKRSGTTEENYAGTFAGSGRGIIFENAR